MVFIESQNEIQYYRKRIGNGKMTSKKNQLVHLSN